MESKRYILGIEFKQNSNIMEKTERAPVTTLNSSTSLDNDVRDVYIPETSTHLSVTTVLHYCKSKILNPYLKVLSFVGLRPITCGQEESCLCLRLISHAYILLGIVLMVIGYVLQYLACFRRERGFCYIKKSDDVFVENKIKSIYVQTCDGSFIFSFVIPSVLLLAGYLHAVVVTRNSDDEHIPVLMERVFLLSTHLSNGFISQKKLVKTLWLFIIFSIIWMASSFTLVNYMVADGEINFKWINHSPSWITTVLKCVLVVCTLWHDIVQATIISNYCLQAQLLTSYVQFLKEKLLQYPVQPLEWMREIEDFKKLLNYLNDKIAPSVCLLTLVNISFMLSGVLWIFHFDHTDSETVPIFGLSIFNVLLWIFISISPFVQSARLSNACEVLKTVGQEVRARPYVHQDTPTLELDSVLLYTTSLKINAKLYHLPITGKKICFCVTVVVIALLVLGQCHYLNPK